MTLFIAIYVAGCVISYFMLRLLLKKFYYWTKGTRVKALVLSFFSWAAVIASGVHLLIDYESDEPASW